MGEISKRAGWDLKRLVQTLVFFGAIPFLSNCNWFVQMTGQTGTIAYGQPQTGQTATLLVGDDGNLTQVWMERLRNRGDRVRLVDVSKTPHLVMEYFAGVSRQLLVGQVSQGISAVVVSSDRPEAAEYAKTAIAQADWLSEAPHKMLFDFRQSMDNLQEIWGAVDDVVMGGVSSSGMNVGEGSAIFSGVVSTDNSGGFASVRTRNLEPPLNLSEYDGIQLRVKGDGQRYKFLVRDEKRWDGVAYAVSFNTSAGEWIDVRIPFADLIPVLRAKTLPNAGPVNAGSISALQVMLSKFEYDGALNPHFKAGEFALELESISAYSTTLSSTVTIDAAQTGLIAWLEQQNIDYAQI